MQKTNSHFRFLSLAHQRLVLWGFAFLILFSLLGIHGFSTSVWHSYIDGTPPKEVLYGKPRDIRSDDWLIYIPLILAQSAASPKFPVVNDLIATHTNALVPFHLPVAHLAAFFKPITWGFFINNNTGLAWLFWTKFFGIFYGAFLVFSILTRNQFSLSFWAAVTFALAPYFQFWTFQNSEPLMHGCFAFAGIVGLLFAQSTLVLLGSGLLFGWQSVAFVVDNIYPPTQIVSGWFFLLLLGGLSMGRRKELALSVNRNVRIAATLLALGIIGIGLGIFFRDALEAIQRISNTTYPGSRMVSGGGFPLRMLFSNNFLPRYQFGNIGEFGNFCEAASFLLFFPISILFFLLKPNKTTEQKWLFAAAVSALSLFVWYSYFGLPDIVALVTGMGKTTPNRTQGGIGFADICLVLLLIHFDSKASLGPKKRKWILVLWCLATCLMALYFFKTVTLSHRSRFWIPVLLNFALGWLLLSPQYNRKYFFQIMGVGLFFYTLGFNPIVWRGSEYLTNNPLATQLRKINDENPAKNNFAVFGSNSRAMVLANLLRINGIRSINGYHPQPQLDIFKALGADMEKNPQVNQCAFLLFSPEEKSPPTFRFEPGHVYTSLSPLNPGFKTLGVTHYLFIESDPSLLVANSDYVEVFSQDKIRLFHRIR